MRTLISTILLVVFASVAGAKTAFSPEDVEKLLSRMTLEEKIGQMMQLESSQLGAKDAQGVFRQ